MKHLLYILLLSVNVCFAMRAPENAEEKSAWYQKMQKNIDAISNQENNLEKIRKLESYLFKLGVRSPHPDDEWNASLIQVQQALLRYPNHAKYFIDQIEAERAKLSDGPIISGTRNDYNGLRLRIIRDTLRHLPSPEVVAALGKLLYDERDTPPKMRPGQDWIDAKSNAYQAAEALRKIGIRHAPVAKDSYNEEADLATWRLWWEQVQAGNKSFSFEGQAIAYRFTKQGSFEIVAPDDGSQQNKALGNADSSRKNPLSPQWIAVIIISVLTLTGVYVTRRKTV